MIKIETQKYLEIVAECIMSGHASVFVGAGFSKNAKLEPGGVLPPNWDELGNLFFEKTRKHKPNKSELAYANVLRFAEEVENMFGRDELSRMIKVALNDDMMQPSDVHMQLLTLPWKNVYTTNYDTLLERAASSLSEQGRRIYSIIRNDEAIGMETPPFLMKLHGDINDPQSIIITEEDYRTYSAKHQAMINHVRNAIMMDTMVLIGFSGNDPNFLQWLGWVRDALKNNQRKVYLLSVDSMSAAAKTTFEKKNVIIVDLNGVTGKDSHPSENISGAISFIENFISQKNKDRDQYRKESLAWGSGTNRYESIEKQYPRWKQEKETYPGWLVMPREKRENWASLEGFDLSSAKIDKLSDEDRILYLDLFNWRIEKSLYPIENRWEPVYLSVLDSIRPFSQMCRSDVKSAWINLKLSLLRLYRQEGWTDKWNTLREELEEYVGSFDEEQTCRFKYEQALEAVYQNDFVSLENVLNSWEECTLDPYWDIRRGAVWAEYLSLEKGRNITAKAFKSICVKLDSASSEADRFYWASRKVHAHTIWNSMLQANFSYDKNTTSAARQTWNELKPYDDIWYEREFFDSNIRSIEEALRVKTTVASFRLGNSRITTNLNGNSKDYRVAYAYFLYYEETGFPIHLPYLSSVKKETLEKALSVMGYCSPAIAACWMLRSGDSKLVSSIYNRRFLERTGFIEVESLYKQYLESLKNLLVVDKSEVVPPWSYVFRNVLSEVLSRLCMKVSYESRIRTLDCIEDIFLDKYSIHYEGLEQLLSSLISTFSKNEMIDLIPRFAGMPIAIDKFSDCRLDPLYYVDEPVPLRPDAARTAVDYLFERFGINENEERTIFFRLLFLHRCGALSQEQSERLASLLWSNVDDDGFPKRTIFNRFAFLSFPHPPSINPQKLLTDYFMSKPIPIIGLQKSISIYGGSVPIFNDIKGTTNSDIQFTWDTNLINHLCYELIQMWDSDKDHLLSYENGIVFSVKEELQNRLAEVESIVVGVIAPHIDLLEDSNKKGLASLATEFENYGMPSLRLRTALATIIGDVADLKAEVLERLGYSEERFVSDCINAVVYLNNTGVDIKDCVEVISEYFRGNSEQGRILIINALNCLLPNNDFLSYGSVRSNVQIGLKRIYASTVIEATDNEFQTNQKMFLRKIVAPIVHILIKGESVFEKNIEEWLNYYNSIETCLDIKNRFLDYQN